MPALRALLAALFIPALGAALTLYIINDLAAQD
jgi:hypothetical protein